MTVSAIAGLIGSAGILETLRKLRREKKSAELEIESYKNIGLAKASGRDPATSLDKDGNIVIRLKDGRRLVVTIEKDSDGKPQVKLKPEGQV